MIITNGEKCPVCDKVFTEEDDIVTCPHCGTPHHRECYNQLGHCANIAEHKENYEYTPDTTEHTDKADNEAESTENSGYFYSPDSSDQNTVLCPVCSAENDSTSAFCSECGARLSPTNFANYSPVSTVAFQPDYQSSTSTATDETIDGRSVSDISAVIGTNASKFIAKFKSNKKISWSWCAFIFGPFYYFYRKMYKEGALIMVARLAVSLVLQGIYTEPFAAFAEFFATNRAELLSKPTTALVDEMMTLYTAILPMMIITICLNLVINICCGMFSYKAYRAKVFSILDKVENNLAEGGSFGINPMFSTDTPLTQEQMKGLYLSKLGGVSFIAPILAYLALEIITSIIAKL